MFKSRVDVCRFNSQPPEGGWLIACRAEQHYCVSTHSRPKAAGSVISATTGTGGRFNSQPPEGGWDLQTLQAAQAANVSTHSRPKAAGQPDNQPSEKPDVSTHSRPKAAGMCPQPDNRPRCSFNSQPPEGGWGRLV